VVDGGDAAAGIGLLFRLACEGAVENECGVAPGFSECRRCGVEKLPTEIELQDRGVCCLEGAVQCFEEGWRVDFVERDGGSADGIEIDIPIEVGRKGFELGEGETVVELVGVAAADVVHLRRG